MGNSNVIDTSLRRPAGGGSGSVLVTGGTGFLGAHIIRTLVEKGYRVKAIRRGNSLPFFIPAAILEQVEWIAGDILDVVGLEEAMQGMDAVIHAAAKVSFAGGDRKEMFHTNIEGTANMVNAALAHNIPRFLYISSVAVLGRPGGRTDAGRSAVDAGWSAADTTKDGTAAMKGGMAAAAAAAGEAEMVTEEKKWEDGKGASAYAISKYHAEMEVWRGIAEGLNATIVNPSTVLGYGNWDQSSCAIFKSVYREFPWYTNGVNGFVAVGDVARAVEALLSVEASGERYILCGDNRPYRQVFNAAAKGFGKKQPEREATPFLSGIAWRLEKLKTLVSGRPTLLTRESARVAQRNTRYDSGKLLRKLPGFRFTPLQEAIEIACKAYLEGLQQNRT